MANTKKKATTKRKVGKPTKYKKEYCEQLIEWMAEGRSLLAFAGKLRVSRTTLQNWVDTYPEFKEAKEIGNMASLMWWEELNRDMACSTDADNKNRNFNSLKLNMINRFRELYTENGKDKGEADQVLEVKMKFNPEDL